MSRNEINIVELIEWNRSRLTVWQVEHLQNMLNHLGAKLTVDRVFGPATLTAVLSYQHSKVDLVADGKAGRQTFAALERETGIQPMLPGEGGVARLSKRVDFDAEQVGEIMRGTILHESAGKSNPFAAQNRDLEYEGWFDRPSRDDQGHTIPREKRERRHWASKFNANGGAHIGLSWGCIQFTQDGGALGAVLREAANLDRALFDEIMGQGDALLASQLLQITNAPGDRKPSKEGARSPRVQPINGADLWQKPWIERFDEAAKHDVFKRAQIAVAATNYLWPAIQIVLQYGVKNPSQEDIAVALDLCVHLGPGRLPREDRFVSEKGVESFKPQGKGAVRWWEQAVQQYMRPVVASEVIKLMAKSERARREKIMRNTDEYLCYDRTQLKRFTAEHVKRLALDAPLKGA